MIHLSTTDNSISFSGKQVKSNNLFSNPKATLAAAGLLLCLNAGAFKSSLDNDKFEKNVETIDMHAKTTQKVNSTSLNTLELVNAPNPKIVVKGEEKIAGIVVDVNDNKLYRYDENGDVLDGYHVATGKIGRNGKSITDLGLRMVDHVEKFPYRGAPNTKRIKNPSAYGPNVIYLTIVDPKTGNILGSNGEFIHGNNNPASIGKHESLGCIRMDNDVIKQISKEVKKGMFVLIK